MNGEIVVGYTEKTADDIKETFDKISDVIIEKIKSGQEESGKIDGVWALTVVFNSLFNSMMSFLESFEVAFPKESGLSDMVNKIKERFKECGNLEILFDTELPKTDTKADMFH